MAQVTVSTEDLELLIEIAREHGGRLGPIHDLCNEMCGKVLEAESIETTEALDEDLAYEPAPTPHNVQGGTVFGTVSTGYVGSSREFPICSLKEWELCSEEEANQLFQEALWEAIDAGY